MSLREEDKEKNGCPSRGLGLAAAAIGVGVGAALYYFFSKRPENPDAEGATSGQWSCESPQTLSDEDFNSSDDYITVSENTTTDTSINEEIINLSNISSSIVTVSDDTDSSSSDEVEILSSDDSDDSVRSHSNSSVEFNDSDQFNEHSQEMENVDENGNDWEVEMSLELPHIELPSSRPFSDFVYRFISPRIRKSRERSWSLEECSICFEVILQHQEVMTLPCTHHFHQACILPWLQEQQTCPNCRKNID